MPLKRQQLNQYVFDSLSASPDQRLQQNQEKKFGKQNKQASYRRQEGVFVVRVLFKLL